MAGSQPQGLTPSAGVRAHPVGSDHWIVDEVLHLRVRTREEEPFVAIVAPSNEPGRFPIDASDFEDLGVAVRISRVVALDHKPIARRCMHLLGLSSRRYVMRANRTGGAFT